MRKIVTFLLVLASVGTLPAVPALTTIQDILYKADGTRFNGAVSIQWHNFQAGDTSIVATQQITLSVVNGVLKIQLVPTTNASPGANYAVNYSSAGRFQFSETWAVTPSSVPLRVRDVRVNTGTTVGSPGIVGAPIQIADVDGLTNELHIRPIQGAGFAPGRTAFINSFGQIEAVQGNLGDCVTVDGNSTPCGGSGGSGTLQLVERLTGADGATPSFALTQTPSPAASLQLYRNGLLMTPYNVDYQLDIPTKTVTFASYAIPQAGDYLTASYSYAAAGPIIGNQTAAAPPVVLCNAVGGTTASTSLAILGACNIAANKLVAGDRVEIKFGFTHQGTGSGFNPAIYWGGAGLVLRAMAASDSAIVGEATVTVASDGTLAYFTSSAASAGLPLVTSGIVPGNIHNPNTIVFDGSLAQTGAADSLSLNFYTITRYPKP